MSNLGKRISPRVAGQALAIFGLFLLVFVVGWRCPILEVTGVPCPGCYMTRAALRLARGDFAGAFHYHAFVYALPFAAIAYWKFERFRTPILVGLALLMFAYWLVRLTFNLFPN